MAYKKILTLCLVLLLLCAGAGLWHAGQPSPLLVVRNPSGTLVFSFPLPHGQEFGIRFVHSVALSPVEEWFSAVDGHLALQRTVYQDFGAGLPHEAAAGQRMTFAEGRIVISGFSLTLPKLDVRVGRVAGHELLLPGAEVLGVGGKMPEYDTKGGRVLSLSDWATPGTALTFAVENASLWERVGLFFKAY